MPEDQKDPEAREGRAVTGQADSSETMLSAQLETEIGDPTFKVDIVVNDIGKVAVYHSRPFRKKLAWLEFDLETCRMAFIMDDGDARDFGTPVPGNLAKTMQNAHQVLMVLLDEAGQPKAGQYYPLIVHRG